MAIGLGLAALVAVGFASCLEPTEVTVVLTSDLPCDQIHGARISVGPLGGLDTATESATTNACDPSVTPHSLGSIVLVPGGDANSVGIEVVGATTGVLSTCSAMAPAGCIIARRSLRYLAHTPLTLPIALDTACVGIPCASDQTCVKGGCKNATIADPSSCASPDGCGQGTLTDVDGGTVYSPLDDTSKWSTYATTVSDGGIEGFAGAAFDGRYVYLVPYNRGGVADSIVARYDTQGAFTTGGSWSTFNTATLSGGPTDFAGAAFDGRYVYFVPRTYGLVARYDTQAAFTTGGSWSAFDTTTVTAGQSLGLVGSAFDGRYVYFVPYNGLGVIPSGLAMRYDTMAAFTTSTSWSTFDMSTANAGSKGFVGAAFDGRYVYFVPNSNGTSAGLVTRYDTQAGFTTTASWSTFDTTTLVVGAKGFFGAVFDGRYVYFVAHANGASDGIIARYDTHASFTTTGSWSTFDTTTVNAGASGFFGGAFDGRYVYFVPGSPNGVASGILARYDTQAPFATSGSWSTFDMTAVNPAATGFAGAAFDGRYLYFVPDGTGSGGLVARFDSKTPPSLPPGYAHGSFF